MTEPSEPKRRASKRQKWLLAAASTVVAVLLLVALELVLRGFGIGDPTDDPFFDYEAVTGLFEKVEESSDGAIYRTRESKTKLFNPQGFPAVKMPDTYRVFTLGGSTTFGRPYNWRVAFGNWLQVLLQASKTGRNIEVINAGGVSYASYRVVVLLEEVLEYEPDLLVVYTGHNEFLEERVYGDRLRDNALVKLARRQLSGLHTVRWIRGVLSGTSSAPTDDKQRVAAEVETRLDVWEGLNAFTRDDALAEDVLAHFEWNLEAMVRLAKERNVPIVFVTPPANTRDFSPFKSEHRPGIEPAGAKAFAEQLRRGQAALTEGRHADALTALDNARALDDQYAQVHYLTGQAHLAAGEHAEADAAFQRALAEDVCPLRAKPEIVDVVRQVTAKNEVPLVDLVAILAERSRQAHGYTSLGNEEFLDHVHIRIERTTVDDRRRLRKPSALS